MGLKIGGLQTQVVDKPEAPSAHANEVIRVVKDKVTRRRHCLRGMPGQRSISWPPYLYKDAAACLDRSRLIRKAHALLDHAPAGSENGICFGEPERQPQIPAHAVAAPVADGLLSLCGRYP